LLMSIAKQPTIRISRLQREIITALVEAQMMQIRLHEHLRVPLNGVRILYLRIEVASRLGKHPQNPGFVSSFYRSLNNLVEKPLPHGQRVSWTGPNTVLVWPM